MVGGESIVVVPMRVGADRTAHLVRFSLFLVSPLESTESCASSEHFELPSIQVPMM